MQSHPSYHSISACLGRTTPLGASISSCPPAVGWGRGSWFISILEMGKVSHHHPFIQAPRKAIYIRLHRTKPNPNKQLFNMSERINCLQWGTTKQNQWHAMAQSPQTLHFSQSKLEYPAVIKDPCPWLRHWLLTHFTEETEFTGSKTSQYRQADLVVFHSSETAQAFWTLFSCSVLQSPDPEIYSCFPEMGSVTEDLHKEASSKTWTTLCHLPVQNKKTCLVLCTEGSGDLAIGIQIKNGTQIMTMSLQESFHLPRGKGASAFPGAHKVINHTASLKTICLFKWKPLQ